MGTNQSQPSHSTSKAQAHRVDCCWGSLVESKIYNTGTSIQLGSLLDKTCILTLAVAQSLEALPEYLTNFTALSYHSLEEIGFQFVC